MKISKKIIKTIVEIFNVCRVKDLFSEAGCITSLANK